MLGGRPQQASKGGKGGNPRETKGRAGQGLTGQGQDTQEIREYYRKKE